MRVISGEARGHSLKAPKGMTTRPMADKIKGALFSMLSGLLSSSDREWGRILDLYSGSGSIGIEALSRGATWADFVEVNAGVCRVIADNLEHTRFNNRARINNRTVGAFLNNPPGPPNSGGKRTAAGLHRRKGGKYRDKADELANEVAAIQPVADDTTDLPITEHNNGQDLWQYDIIFLDPPYADPKIPNTIEHVARSGLVKPGGLVVIGHWPRLTLTEIIGKEARETEAKETAESAEPSDAEETKNQTAQPVQLRLLRHRRHGDSAFSIYIAGDPVAYGFVQDNDADETDEATEGEEVGLDEVTENTDYTDFNGDEAK